MKMVLAILVFLTISFFLGWGILLMTAGKPWLLIGGSLAFLIAFARIGCKSH